MRGIRRRVNLLWLGGRTIRGPEGSLGPAAATVLGVALATALALTLVSAWGVARGYRDRVTARTPVENGADGPATVARNVVRWEGQVVTVYAVAGETTPPPGLASFPRPGEIYASPALIDRADPDLAQLFDGRDSFTVGPAGLSSPNELLAWIGVEPSRMRSGAGFSRYGNDAVLPPFLTEAGWTVFFAASGALMLLLPLILIAGAAGRVNAGLRERRLHALRILGLTPLQAATLPLVEIGALSIGGTLLGAAIHRVFLGLVGEGPVFGVAFFPTDAAVESGVVALVGGVVVAVTITSAVLPTLRAIRSTSTVRGSLKVGRPRRWPMALLVGSLLSLVVLAMLPAEWAPAARIAGIYLVALAFTAGLVGGLGSFVGWVASKAAPRVQRIEAMVSLRRLEVNPGTATRYLLGVAVMLFFGIGAGNFFESSAASPDFVAETRAKQFTGGKQLVLADVPTGGPDLTSVLEGEDVQAVIPFVDAAPAAGAEPTTEVLLADCDTLRRFARTVLGRCPSRPVVVAAAPESGFVGDLPPPLEPAPVVVETVDGDEVPIRPGDTPVSLGLVDFDPFAGSIVVDPEALDVDVGRLAFAGYAAALDPTPEAADRFRLRLLAAAPAARLYVPGEAGILGTGSWAPVSRYVTVLLGFGALLVLISVAVVGVQMVADRRTRALVAMGCPTGALQRIETLVVMVPATIGLTVAVGGGVAISGAMARVFDAPNSLARSLALYLGALVGAGLIAVVGARRVTRADPTRVGVGD